MSTIYKKIADAKPIRPDDVEVSGCTYAAIEVRDDAAMSESAKYDFPVQRIDYYYQKDDDNLKAVVGKATIDASDNYKAAKKIKSISTVKTFAVGGTDTVTVDSETYTWTATGTTAGAGAWADSDGNPVDFEYTINEYVLDAVIVVQGTTYTKNYLWVKNMIASVAANANVPTTQATGTGTLSTVVSGLATGTKLASKTNATTCAAEGDTGYFKIVGPDGSMDHEGTESYIKYTVFVSEDNEYNAAISIVTATYDYEFAQALDAMETGDTINMSTFAIS